MTSPEPEINLALQVKALLWEKGHESLETAKNAVLQEEIRPKPLQEAMRYFMSSWEDVVHPALLALACEAVGGNPESTKGVGAALILMAGGADIHDDIIDESTVKYGEETVLGKFGKDLAVLSGDALIMKGFYALHETCESLPTKQRKIIFELVKQAFFGITEAEARETVLKKSSSGRAEDYFDMFKTKAAVSEATMRIGAVLGGGSAEETKVLGSLGKAFGVLLTVRDEFVDIFEVDEMKNRVEKEWLPLPILYALQDTKRAKEIMDNLNHGSITEKNLELIIELVSDSEETGKLLNEMHLIIKEQILGLRLLKANRDKFQLILNSSVEDL
jgi:geranylgeranyl pyrophosphate synthase